MARHFTLLAHEICDARCCDNDQTRRVHHQSFRQLNYTKRGNLNRGLILSTTRHGVQKNCRLASLKQSRKSGFRHAAGAHVGSARPDKPMPIMKACTCNRMQAQLAVGRTASNGFSESCQATRTRAVHKRIKTLMLPTTLILMVHTDIQFLHHTDH